ncbi:MAG: multicopper oxidase domain-containing protein [Desulfobaccales bacterium]
MKRREFIKYGTGGLAALVVGTKMPWVMDNPAYASNIATNGIINLNITDAVKQMVTHNPGHPATCYFWIYQDAGPNPVPADCPGPIIFATSGDTITVNVTNQLDAPHAFAIPKLRITTGPIAPSGGTASIRFKVGPAGTYLYYDDLNAPVNRVMGLHGAFIVMPRGTHGSRAGAGHRLTPYDHPGPNVQQLFDDLGHAPWWPGLAWEEGDPTTDTFPYRQQIWLMHQASPNLFTQVGNNATISFTTTAGEAVTGSSRDPVVFTKAFLHDALRNPPAVNGFPTNFVPQYFTISGQSGHFAHNNPYICPYSRVGEPVLIRLLNAGMWLHSTHIHANHIFVLQHNNRSDVFPGSFDNPIWVDVYTSNPLDTYDWLVPYMRPPDVPNDLGIGRDDLEQSLDVSTTSVVIGGFGLDPTSVGPNWKKADVPVNPANPWVPGQHLTWPPLQEINMFIPRVGDRKAKDQSNNDIDCAVRLSPICFPMHDHSEPSQVANGGNYNCGLISGIVFTGDRKGARPGQTAKVQTFPDRPTTGDPMAPVTHGPDIFPNQKGALVAAPEFKMPSIP